MRTPHELKSIVEHVLFMKPNDFTICRNRAVRDFALFWRTMRKTNSYSFDIPIGHQLAWALNLKSLNKPDLVVMADVQHGMSALVPLGVESAHAFVT